MNFKSDDRYEVGKSFVLAPANHVLESNLHDINVSYLNTECYFNIVQLCKFSKYVNN